MITINQLQSTDLRGLKDLYENAFEGSVTDFDKLTQRFGEIENNRHYVILCAREDKRVVGSVLGVVCQELFGQCNPFMVLEDVAVLQSHRRRGIARQLMLRMEEESRERNCSMILFVSSVHRTGAHSLYESLGYGTDKVNGYRKRLL